MFQIPKPGIPRHDEHAAGLMLINGRTRSLPPRLPTTSGPVPGLTRVDKSIVTLNAFLENFVKIGRYRPFPGVGSAGIAASARSPPEPAGEPGHRAGQSAFRRSMNDGTFGINGNRRGRIDGRGGHVRAASPRARRRPLEQHVLDSLGARGGPWGQGLRAGPTPAPKQF